jgi:heme-degrading monooxygenase HmoA
MTTAKLPKPPYYVVTFSSQRTEGDHGYSAMADEMVAMAERQPGYLGHESARGADGFGITNSFWTDEDAIRAWKADLDHLEAQRRGRAEWYTTYAVRVARVERAYSFARAGGVDRASG